MPSEEVPPQRIARFENGHEYLWNEDLEFWYNFDLKEGQNPVQVFPSNGICPDWFVVVPMKSLCKPVRGDFAEEYSFRIAASYISEVRR